MKVSTSLKAGAIALFTLFFSVNIAFADVPATTVIVSGNTTSTENTTGEWIFNRDVSTSTPFEFNNDAHSIGVGSLYVLPVGANAADKFIGENFINKDVSDINSFSYDFKIAGSGDDADKDQFYLNVYANIDNSTNYYDCRFDYVPASGSVSSFTTTTITPSTTPVNVRKRGSRIAACPATLAGMPAGSYVRAIAINLGDTSASDAGLAGYFDNVIVNLKQDAGSDVTIFDFEEMPQPTPTPTPGKTSGLEITALSCSNRNFDVIIDLDDNNQPAVGVKVKFTYNGKVANSVTDAEGKARGGFTYEGDMSVKVEPENGFPGHDRHVQQPQNLVCDPGVGGQVQSTGEVLGVTTMAQTGVVTDFLVKSIGSLGGMLTTLGSILYAKKKRS